MDGTCTGFSTCPIVRKGGPHSRLPVVDTKRKHAKRVVFCLDKIFWLYECGKFLRQDSAVLLFESYTRE